jgi:hypothetical protein
MVARREVVKRLTHGFKSGHWAQSERVRHRISFAFYSLTLTCATARAQDENR